MKTACKDDSCSLDKRNEIINEFFDKNVKVAFKADESFDQVSVDELRNIVESAKVLDEMGKHSLAEEVLSRLNLGSEGEVKVDSESNYLSDPSNFQETISNSNSDTEDYFREDFPQPGSDTVSLASLNKNNIKLRTKNALEELMRNSKLEKRAQARRKLAYMQGGSEGREPNTFKEEKYTFDNDKQMKQTGNLGGDKGLAPGDAELKAKLSRAAIQERAMKRMAYMQGGSEGREPNTFKEEKVYI